MGTCAISCFVRLSNSLVVQFFRSWVELLGNRQGTSHLARSYMYFDTSHKCQPSLLLLQIQRDALLIGHPTPFIIFSSADCSAKICFPDHPSVQVIPTVGVDGDNADKNKRAMLKHFRNLVDETASKATFLAAFKRSGSGKEAFMESSEPSNASEDLGMELASDLEDDSRDPSGNAGLEEEDEAEIPRSAVEEGAFGFV